LSAAEDKWKLQTDVMCYHMHEGSKVASISSARMERYLQLCASVIYVYSLDVTTQHKVFILAGQMKVNFRKPLIFFYNQRLTKTPKAFQLVDGN